MLLRTSTMALKSISLMTWPDGLEDDLESKGEDLALLPDMTTHKDDDFPESVNIQDVLVVPRTCSFFNM